MVEHQDASSFVAKDNEINAYGGTARSCASFAMLSMRANVEVNQAIDGAGIKFDMHVGIDPNLVQVHPAFNFHELSSLPTTPQYLICDRKLSSVVSITLTLPICSGK